MSEAMSKTLPPLPETPETFRIVAKHGQEPFQQDLYTAEQMQAYALAAIEAQCVPDGWREFVQRVAGQKPEKPDYWSACGQCERNISDAEDLLASATPAPQAKQCEWTNCPTRVGDKCCNEQPREVQQEPVAWLHKGGHVQVRAPYLSAEAVKGYSTNGQWTPLYTHPAPQAKPQPLSDEQIEAIFAAIPVDKYDGVLSVARAIEAAHNIGEKK